MLSLGSRAQFSALQHSVKMMQINCKKKMHVWKKMQDLSKNCQLPACSHGTFYHGWGQTSHQRVKEGLGGRS
jgi:hypothetical protein